MDTNKKNPESDRWKSIGFFITTLFFVRSVFLVITLMFFLAGAFAQTHQGFNYQAIIRDNSGQPMINENVNIRVELVQGTETGSVAYDEIHITQTNAFGLANLIVGSLHPDVFADITWADGPYFIRISVNGLVMGVSPMLSVPYAMYAHKAGEPGPEGPPGEPGTSSWVDGDEFVTTPVKVGIGANSPSASLHVSNFSAGLGDVLFQGSFDGSNVYNPPASGAGTRMMWYPAKAAFRAGRVSDTQWDKVQVGEYSAAMGLDAKARGNYSFAVGLETEATGDLSIAMGFGTIASGVGAVALGANTSASGFRSTAMGNETIAFGDFSTAMGFKTQAMGLNSTAMGDQNIANGNNAKTWGFMNLAGGTASTAWGMDVEVSGQAATAWGVSTFAPASGATAWGNSTGATGGYSTAWGEGAQAKALNSTSWGRNTNTEGVNSTAWGDNSSATAISSTAWGSGTLSSGSYSTSWGQNNEATGVLSTVWGVQSKATGGQSTAWGLSTHAAGTRTTAWGYGTMAQSANETVLGHFNTLYLPFSQVNINASDRLFVVGNGTSDSNRSNALTLLKNGKMSLGNTNPASTLHIKHNVINSGALPQEGLRLENSGAGDYFWNFYTDNFSGALILFNSQSGSIGIGSFSGTNGSYLTTSSRSLKTNIHALDDDILSLLLRLKPVHYQYTHLENAKPQIGFIAEEVAEIFPQFTEIVDPENQIMAVDYSGFSVVAVKAIQQQQAVIEDLNVRVKEQEQMINELIERLDRLEK